MVTGKMVVIDTDSGNDGGHFCGCPFVSSLLRDSSVVGQTIFEPQEMGERNQGDQGVMDCLEVNDRLIGISMISIRVWMTMKRVIALIATQTIHEDLTSEDHLWLQLLISPKDPFQQSVMVHHP